MHQLRQNSNRWVIVSHMSRNVWVSPRELFEQFNKAGYRFFSRESFLVTLSALNKDGFLEHRESPHKPERKQFRLAAGIILQATPKAASTLKNMMYEAKRAVRARELLHARP